MTNLRIGSKVEDGNADIYTIHADGSGLTNLTNNLARDAYPIWSRDGKRIIFESDRTGITQIYMMNADGSNTMQLTNDNTEHFLSPTDDIRLNVWSPDGNRFLFVQKESDGKTNDLYSLDTNNGTRILLASDTRGIGNASWSPNGEYVGYVLSEEVKPGGFVPHLYIVDATGNNIQELSSYLAENEQVFTPYFWASDGRSIIFPAIGLGYEENRATIHQLDPQENALHTLMTTKAMLYEWYGGVALGFDSDSAGEPLVWQRPDGTSAKLDLHKHANPENCFIGRARSLQGNLVIGGYCKKDDNLSLYWTNMDGSQIQPLPEVIVPIVNGRLTGLTLSPDEKFLAFNFMVENETNLYIWDVKDALENPTSQPIEVPIGNAGGQYFIQSWQPIFHEDIIQVEQPVQANERLLAFTKEDNGNNDIYISYADGSNLTRLTNNPSYDGYPFWSPDGKRIAFESDRTGSMQIYLMDADGSNVIQLTQGEGNYAFDVNGFSPWSPDGRKLILSHKLPEEKYWKFFVVDVDGKNLTILTNEPGEYILPSWSSDGEHIAFVSAPSGRLPRQIFVVDKNGDNLTRLTEDLPGGENFMFGDYIWAQDGKSVIFTTDSNAGGTYQARVYKANLDGSRTLITAADKIILDWRNGTTLMDDPEQTFSWLRPDGSHSTLDPCLDNGDRLGITHQRSNNGNLIIGSYCNSGGWMFYWSNPDGTITNKLLYSSIPIEYDAIFNVNWSPDDNFIALVALNTNTPDVMETLYVIDVAAAQKSPSIQPLELTDSYGPSWQPIP